jgi:hypothetical protein
VQQRQLGKVQKLIVLPVTLMAAPITGTKKGNGWWRYADMGCMPYRVQGLAREWNCSCCFSKSSTTRPEIYKNGLDETMVAQLEFRVVYLQI